MENRFNATKYPNRIEVKFIWRKPRHNEQNNTITFYDDDSYSAFKKFLSEPSLARMPQLGNAFNWNITPWGIDRDRTAFSNEVFLIDLFYYLDFSKSHVVVEADRTTDATNGNKAITEGKQ